MNTDFVTPTGVVVSKWDLAKKRFTINDLIVNRIQYATTKADVQAILDEIAESRNPAAEASPENNPPTE